MRNVLPILIVAVALGILGYIFVSTLGSRETGPTGPPPRDRPSRPPDGDTPPDFVPADGPDRGDGGGTGSIRTGDLGEISVEVAEAGTGMPVANAAVKAVRGGYRKTLRTDALGTCRFTNVPVGTVRLRALTSGHEDGPMSLVEVEKGEVASVQFTLHRGSAIRGRVVDAETGAPIPGARVSAQASTEKNCVAEPDGSYRLAGFGPGVALIQAEADLYPRLRQAITVSSRDEDVVQDIVLMRGAVVRGTVTDLRGERLAGASVGLRRGGGVRVVTDSDGGYVLAAVPPDRQVYITAEHDGYVPAHSKGLRFRVGEEASGVDLVLQKGATVKGRVLLPDGKPAMGAVVRIAPLTPTGIPGRLPTVRTGDDGTFELGPVAPGDHRITASMPGTIFVREDVSGIQESGLIEGIELRLGSAVVISGEVRDHTGKPQPGVTVMARPLDTTGPSRWGSGRTDSTGKFTLSGLLPGVYSVRARSTQGGLESPSVEVPAGTTDLSLTLPAPGRMSGRAVDGSGAPVKSYSLTVLPVPGTQAGARIYRRIQDAEGRFDLKDVAPGTYELSASGIDGFSDRVPPVTVAGGSVVQGIVLTLRSGGALRGHVVGSDGRPVAGARINVNSAPGGPRSRGGRGTSNADGSFEVKGLRPGEYQAVATRDGYSSSSALFTAISGGVAEVALSFPPLAALRIVVVDGGGRPVPGVSVRVRDAGGRTVRARPADVPESVPATERAAARQESLKRAQSTDSHGVCIREGVPVGSVAVTVMAKGFADGSAKATVQSGGTTTVKVTLQPGESSMDRKVDGPVRPGGRR